MRPAEEFTDTDPRALEVWLSLQRRMPLGDKLLAVLEASRFLLQMYEAGVRLDHPRASEREIFLRTAARHLDRNLMIRAYGWDPGLDDNPGRRP
jgi:hypothetical protein